MFEPFDSMKIQITVSSSLIITSRRGYADHANSEEGGSVAMPLIDLRSALSEGVTALTKCDVCIIGSGPAGSTLAEELSNCSLAVTLLESGGFERTAEADALNVVENIGHPRMVDQWEVRNRILGGSSHTWGGRCAPFDEIDFERREWVPFSGWPFSRDVLKPYFVRSGPPLGLAVGDGFTDDGFWTLAGLPAPSTAPDGDKLRNFIWQFSRDLAQRHDYMRFGPNLLGRIGQNITVVTSATALRIIPEASGRAVEAVEFTGPDGKLKRLAAGVIALCSGGIENPRLLLSSNSLSERGLGNAHDQVGRYLMDHPRGRVGTFDPSHSLVLQRRLGRINVRGRLFRPGFRLSPERQREEGLLNCAAWLGEEVAPDDPWEALKNFIRKRHKLSRDITALLANADIFLGGMVDYLILRRGVRRKLSALSLDAMCEQRPDPESRITLSDQRDRFGMRLPKVDWRIHPDEPRTVRRIAEIVAIEMRKMGLPEPTLSEWVRQGQSFDPSFLDVAHPTGATRMSEDPRNGVVDCQCQVHGIHGLYVSGSSVFPTAGHCNPTQMIVALAIRLADHIKRRS